MDLNEIPRPPKGADLMILGEDLVYAAAALGDHVPAQSVSIDVASRSDTYLHLGGYSRPRKRNQPKLRSRTINPEKPLANRSLNKALFERVDLSTARVRLDDLLDRVEAGKSIEITRRGGPAALLVPVTKNRQCKPIDVAALRAAASKIPYQEKSGAEIIREMRDAGF